MIDKKQKNRAIIMLLQGENNSTKRGIHCPNGKWQFTQLPLLVATKKTTPRRANSGTWHWLSCWVSWSVKFN
jgi:hypothetical protein